MTPSILQDSGVDPLAATTVADVIFTVASESTVEKPFCARELQEITPVRWPVAAVVAFDVAPAVGDTDGGDENGVLQAASKEKLILTRSSHI
jgi:hypothetical protein